ncbi:3'(2'),5'-bisphosphate nucleotidase CysQ [Aestuariibacter sp. AA17]|uniref:3'(2'),5'-bisphosphate nucleotidase CysQ n=1 Tax=Fluctibacter corallii TaxID=2984329 RepID=A0ABT3AA99_9ALTE|nr:3'(2'),5'-bisphosphate nucleotidase CysQ [Aestuariibacter sp. AA17]MCV2885603.1 3'(2'),5'-bisphosphate nucleotidase CysQ [Aestuariibacter sp. AA17]
MVTLEQIIVIAEKAGSAILEIYGRDFDINTKADESPLTEADLASHNIIVDELAQLSDLPILSEESADIPWQTRQNWKEYWLVDPLDGTKEFIKKNGEFTVNIALIKDGRPVMGVVNAPVLEKTYAGSESEGAYVLFQGKKSAISPAPRERDETWKVVGSRSHQSADIQRLLESLDGDYELIPMGSSLKLCLIAEGQAHLYPRIGPTSEWDTAAAHAVVEAAGAYVHVLDAKTLTASDAEPLRYNQKESLLNPYFLVSC